MPTTNYAIPYFSGSAAADDVSGTSQPPLDAIDAALASLAASITASLPKYAGTEVSVAPAATNPPANTVKIIQDFTKVCTTESAGGGFTIALPTGFPNAVMGATITLVTGAAGAAYLQPYLPGWSKTQLYSTCVTTAGAGIGAGQSVTVSVHAWGW